MQPKDYYQTLLQAIDDKTLIITVNQRLADHLQAFTGLKTVFSQSAWIDQLWSDYHKSNPEAPRSLSPLVEQWLWREVIQHSTIAESLLNHHDAAKQAQNAWKLCVEWNQPLESIPTPHSDEVQAFIEW